MLYRYTMGLSKVNFTQSKFHETGPETIFSELCLYIFVLISTPLCVQVQISFVFAIYSNNWIDRTLSGTGDKFI